MPTDLTETTEIIAVIRDLRGLCHGAIKTLAGDVDWDVLTEEADLHSMSVSTQSLRTWSQ